MNVKEIFLEWFSNRDTYKNLSGNTIIKFIERNIEFLNIDPFILADDFSNIEEIKTAITESTTTLQENPSYKDFQSKSSNYAPEAILGKNNYFKFLDEIKKNYDTRSFKQTIEELRIELERDANTSGLFKIGKIAKDWAWVGDTKGIIGNVVCHYEISLGKVKGNRTLYSVEIHFEAVNIDEQYQFNPIINQLPIELEPIKWRKVPCIRYKECIPQFHPNLIDELKVQLLFLEKTLGDQLREIIVSKKINVQIQKTMNKIYPLNQILFGPPGTGKTYNTINKALEIINDEEEKNLDWSDRKAIKAQFEKRMNEEQIVFTTFHQSMSYEDFIEGIKPIEPKQEGQAVNYKVVDGIFKKACAMAAYNCYKLFTKSKTQPDKYSFDDLYEAFIEFIKGQIIQQNPPTYKTLRGRDVEVKEINSNDSIIARAKNSIANSSAPLTKENIQKLYDKFKTIEEIEDLKQVQETVQVTPRITEFYAVFSGLKEFEKTYKPDVDLIIENNAVEILDFDEIQKKFNAGVYKEAIKRFGKEATPVVIIIDEINRGNVSQIFGELITLIEEDKRLGKDEAITLCLPYSKKEFGVPPNLYIIGTMNTADRSVEALDAALRRRFSFEEMLPNVSLIATEGKLKNINGVLDKIDLPIVLKTINKRIEKLLDKDHQIGHSYFMSVTDIDTLKAAFQNKIIPLLQEYFFGDYGKIGLVLGNGFFETLEKNEDNIFADFDDYDASEFSERPIYKIQDILNMTEVNFNLAINNLLKKKVETN